MRIRGWSPKSTSPAKGTIVFFAALRKPLPVPSAGGLAFASPTAQATIIEEDESAPALMPADPDGVCLRFWQVEARDPDMQGAIEAVEKISFRVLGHLLPERSDDPVEVPDARVVVTEMVTPLPDVDSSVQIAFRRCFDCLQDVSRAFGNSLRPPYAPLELSDVFPSVLFAAPSDRSGTDHQFSMYLIPGSIPEDYMSPDDLNRDQVTQFSVHLRRLREGDPFTLCSERAHRAQAAAHAGDFTTAVIDVAVASEILLDAVLSCMLWEEKFGAADAATALGRSVSQWMRGDFPQRLGGSWDQTGAGPVAAWRADIANVRNRIVHRGYRPSEAEGDSALHAFERLDGHVRERLVEKRLDYPRTALLLLGEPGLQRLGGLSRRMRDRVAELNEDPDTWVRAHVDWRDAVDRST